MIKPSYTGGVIMVEEKKIPNGLFQLGNSKRPHTNPQDHVGKPSTPQNSKQGDDKNDRPDQ